MNNVLKYDNFVNEKIGPKELAMAAGITLSSVLGGCYDKGVAKIDKIQTVGKEEFKEYSLCAEDETFDLTLNQGFIVSQHSYETHHGSGKNRHTETHSFTNLMIPKGTKFIWYKTKFFGNTIAGPKPFEKSHLIKMDELEIYKQTDAYIIYTVKRWNSPFNYVIMIKDSKKLEGEEYKLSDSKLGNYICQKINKDIYIFSLTGLNKGQFGGGGSGGEF